VGFSILSIFPKRRMPSYPIPMSPTVGESEIQAVAYDSFVLKGKEREVEEKVQLTGVHWTRREDKELLEFRASVTL